MNPAEMKLRFRLASLALACGLSAAFVPATQAGAIDDFQRYVAGRGALTGQFTQESATGSKLRRTSGTFAIARPGKFRWAIDKPFEQLIVSDGAKVWFWDKDLNQVTVRQLKDALSATPVALLLGGELLAQFNLKEGGERDGLQWLEATPKGKDLQFQRIAVGLKDGVPMRMELVDAFNQTSRIQFAQVNNAAQPAANSFTFSPPAGADVLQQ
ncbi:outer membrane lipoprotein chaperone LolA [Piscinibacterium candidicorallinum]|jgi:outer membrane lipoprotein carrier protein|uniref:Outer-membrane lipoprotein carrier protein n=1 Tax=Piscinibacterium candidicorallinum TaxID=1793872 RepID=A0ABV7H0E6_9BURK